jgi:hypothetical protein
MHSFAFTIDTRSGIYKYFIITLVSSTHAIVRVWSASLNSLKMVRCVPRGQLNRLLPWRPPGGAMLFPRGHSTVPLEGALLFQYPLNGHLFPPVAVWWRCVVLATARFRTVVSTVARWRCFCYCDVFLSFLVIHSPSSNYTGLWGTQNNVAWYFVQNLLRLSRLPLTSNLLSGRPLDVALWSVGKSSTRS